MKVVCAVLAAGRSSRMGTPKQLLELEGRPLIARIVEACCASPCSEVAVVIGAHATQVQPAYAHTRARSLPNPRWASGLSTSLHTAIAWALGQSAAGLLVCVCDQPLLSRAHVEALYTTFVASRRSVASRYNGTRGVPALLDASLFERALTLEGDRGAGALLRTNPDVLDIHWSEGAIDLDTREQVLSYLNR